MRQHNKTVLKTLRQKLRKTATPAERKIWSIIKNRKIKDLRFFRQYSVGNCILDFYCPAIRLCLEIDGGQHFEEKNKIDDQTRTEFLNSSNIEVLRFQNNDVLQNIEGVYNKITQTIGLINPF
ncbi:MAG: endonuclease domain-containing protein [Candidatus Doudnabacteria bacterium]|nr:endonuclease domain-containing protein [Candidatus Doudnabacteria bacterium]